MVVVTTMSDVELESRDGYGGDSDLERTAAEAVEIASDAGYSDCSDLLMHDEESKPQVAPAPAPVIEAAQVIEDSPAKKIEKKVSVKVFMEPGDLRAPPVAAPVPRRIRVKSCVAPACCQLSKTEIGWRVDMARWSKFIRTPMEEHLLSIGPQTEKLNIVSPFCGNWSEGFEALAARESTEILFY